MLTGAIKRDEKTAAHTRIIIRGGEGAARKVVREFSAICSYGVYEGLLTTNPCIIARVNKTDRERTNFIAPALLQAYLTAIDDLEKSTGNVMGADIVRLLFFTGAE